MKKRNLDGSVLSFPQDDNIHFDEPTHTYTVDGCGEMTPVSSVVGQFFTPFDAFYHSLRKCEGNHLAAAKLREEWEAKGKCAAQMGTHLHKQIEAFLNTGDMPQVNCHLSYNGKYIRVERDENIVREWQMFMDFHQATDYHPFRTEWAVYDTDMRMAGTVDLIAACADGTYELFDWKRSNKINPSEYNRWSTAVNGLEHLTDTTYMHYCLQQNLYRYMLEKNYGLRISGMHLVVLHPSRPAYELVEVPRMEREIGIIRHRICG